MKRYVVEETTDTSRDTVATSRPRAPPPTHPRTAGATANLTTHTMHTPPSPAGAFVDRKQVQATTSPEGKRMGLLARYSKYSHDRPWTGFGLVLFVVFLLTTVVGAANLAAFSTDDSDKVRARPLSEAYNAIVKTSLFFLSQKKKCKHSASVGPDGRVRAAVSYTRRYALSLHAHTWGERGGSHIRWHLVMVQARDGGTTISHKSLPAFFFGRNSSLCFSLLSFRSVFFSYFSFHFVSPLPPLLPSSPVPPPINRSG
jgi:hypothetical protein